MNNVYRILILYAIFTSCDYTYRGETQYNMEVVSDSGQVVLVQIFIGWWSPWKLFLHDGDKFSHDLIHLISGKQVSYLSKQKKMTKGNDNSHQWHWYAEFCWQKVVALSESHGHLRFLRRGRCWGTPGKLRPWSPGQWRWRWFPYPGHQLYGTGTSGLLTGWTHCTTCQSTNPGSVLQEIQTIENNNKSFHLKSKDIIPDIYNSEHGFDDPNMWVTYSHSEMYDSTDFYFVVIIHSNYLPTPKPYFFYNYHVKETINIMQWIEDCDLSLPFNIFSLVEYNTFCFYTNWIYHFFFTSPPPLAEDEKTHRKKSAVQVSYINNFKT